MAASAGGIYVDLGLNSARFSDGLKRAGTELKTFGAQAQKVGGVARAALAGVGDGLKLGLAGISLAGLGAGFKAITSELAQLNAEAKRAGVGVEAFQELGFAARQSLVGIDALTDGLKEMQLRADEFITTGGGGAAEAFQRLGYGADQLKEKLRNPADLFQEIIDKLAQIDRAEAIRISDEIFGGTGGEQFVQMLDRGVGSIAKLRAEARATGNVLSKELVDKAAEMDRQFANIAATVGNNVKAAIVAAAAALAPFIDMLNKVENQSTSTLQRRADLLREALKRYENYGFSDSFIADRKAELKQLDDMLATRPPAVTITPTVPTVPPPAKDKGSGKTREPKASYDDLIAVAQERIAQMQIEQQALNLTAGAAEALRLKEELLATAKRENIALSPQDVAGIEEKARLYGQLVDATNKAADAQAMLNDLSADALGGFVSDLRSGVSAAQALANALGNLADRMLDVALNSLFDASGGGGLAKLFGGLAKGGPVTPLGMGGIGRAATGGSIRGPGSGTSDSIPMMLSNGEYVVNAKQAAKFAPLLEAINAGKVGAMAVGGAVGGGLNVGRLATPRLPSVSELGTRGGDTVNVSMNMPINAPGADAAALERLRNEVVQLKQGIPKQAVEAIINARRRNVKI